MHYYQFNIGDYASHTRHLSMMEDLIYRRLLDWYYLNEKPIPKDCIQASRLIQAKDHFSDVEQVLNEFFTLTDDGWINKRADVEISHFKAKSEQASKAGKASAQARFNGRSTDVQPNNNHKPLTNNQETKEKHTRDKRADIFPEIENRSLVEDWMKIRKLKKLAVTDTALEGFKSEIEKAGWSIEDALTKCCHEGWGGFKASWVKDSEKPNSNGKFDINSFVKEHQ